MTSVNPSRLVLAALAASLFLMMPACVQPGSIDDPAADGGPGGGDEADADINNPTPDADLGDQPDADTEQPPATDPSFATDVYPILQINGAGCAGCHASGSQAAFLPYNDGAAAVYGRLKEGTLRVNTANPEASYILQKPLTGSPQSHRAKIFANTQDARYQTILKWIQAGAKP